MAFAFCLTLDHVADAAVIALWHALAAGGAGDDMLHLGYRPHLSLAVLDSEPPVAVVQSAFDAVRDTPELRLQLGSSCRFDGTNIVWLAVDGGDALTALHQRLLEKLPTDLVREHYRSGAWTPHVTLQTGGDAETALHLADTLWPVARVARFTRIELVQFPPVRVLDGCALR